MENDLVTAAFSADRLAVLEMLAAQVAISMENALLLAKEQAARAAAEAAERRSAFVAHELKTPLATIELRLAALTESVGEQETLSSASLSPSIVALKRQFDRMNGLVESLLESARVQTGQLTLTRQELDITDVIRDVVDLLAEQAERSGCQLEVESPGPVRGQWDRLRLEQVVTNLLNNSFKYGAGKPIRIVIDSQATTARFSVTDQGIGISEADQTRLFEPFARATELHQRQSLGVGLCPRPQIVRSARRELPPAQPARRGNDVHRRAPSGRTRLTKRQDGGVAASFQCRCRWCRSGTCGCSWVIGSCLCQWAWGSVMGWGSPSWLCWWCSSWVCRCSCSTGSWV